MLSLKRRFNICNKIKKGLASQVIVDKSKQKNTIDYIFGMWVTYSIGSITFSNSSITHLNRLWI